MIGAGDGSLLVMHPIANDTRLDKIDPSLVSKVRAMPKPYDQFVELVDALIAHNPKLTYGEPADSEAQRAIATIATLDMHVQNGGLMQLFWNCPQLAEHVSPALRLIGAAALAEQFDKAIEQLAGSIDSFIQRREADGLDDFVAAAEDNDVEWFENLYFGEHNRTTGRWSGLVEQMYERSVSYMLANLKAFVRPRGAHNQTLQFGRRGAGH